MKSPRFPLAPGFVLGAVLAGLFDGIVLHQILQWHHMICIEEECAATTVDILRRQNFYDGVFHAVMWAGLIVGLVMLTRHLRAGRTFSGNRFWGSIALGAGVFNVVEGIIDHHILEIHHVRFGPNRPVWDVGFLVVSLAIALLGWLVVRRRAAA